jgi:hypothetical protein
MNVGWQEFVGQETNKGGGFLYNLNNTQLKLLNDLPYKSATQR